MVPGGFDLGGEVNCLRGGCPDGPYGLTAAVAPVPEDP